MRSTDVVIVGGGIIGCASARALAARGARVLVVERGRPGRAATWAAAGMLSPGPEPLHATEIGNLAIASFERYPGFVAELEERTGVDVGYDTSGRLHVALDERAAADLEQRVHAAADFGARLLDADAAAELESELSPHTRGAVFIADDHRVDNTRLGAALWSAAIEDGVQFRIERAAVALRAEGPRCAGVRLEDGEAIAAESVVIAAGAWSGGIAGLPRPLPVRPVRGQMFSLRAPGIVRHTITSRDAYLVPRRQDLLVGATVEDVGFADGPTPRGLEGLMSAAAALLPRTADLPVERVWAGFRPGTPDGLPVLGPDPDLDGLFYATGHYRSGILLAPITAELIAELLTGGTLPVAIQEFAVDRFPSASESDESDAHGRVDEAARWSRIADRADYDPDYDPDAPVLCERCGDVMVYTRSCRIVCRNCGMTRDCADP